MRLRSLEIKGFKSFANKTLIHFNEPIIGIVGPNGSGKSNIIDSIRWVLGEQKSKELRLESMGDVLFNGTKNRKKSGVAQVTLTFENTKNILPTEYQNVSISRLLYRSGESEYRLNDVKCRLKDITDLFLDSGIGSNSYAIIELGMVDNILHDKDDSRRKMFEQASGISKFKIRKRETLGKLKLTEADLDRVEDLLFELEGNMKNLEKQARRTERFFKLKEKYKTLSLQFSKIKLDQIASQIKQLKEKIGTERDKTIKVKKEIAASEANYEKQHADNLKLEQKLSVDQKEANSIFEKIRNLENEKRIQVQRSDFYKQNITRLEQVSSEAESELSVIQTNLDRLNAQLLDATKSYDVILKSHNVAEKAYQDYQDNFKSLDEAARNESKIYEENQAKRYRYEKEIAIQESTLASHTNQVQNLFSELEISNAQVAKRLADVDTQKKEFAEIEAKKNALVERKEATKKKQENVVVALESEKEMLKKESRKLDSKKHEYELLKSMIENLEGFPDSVKFIHENYKGKLPLLSDIFDCEQEYKAALEKYVEPYLYHFIVHDETTAFDAIETLKSSQKGRANFLIKSKFNANAVEDAVLPGLTRAIDVIDFNPEYRDIIHYLFKNVYVSDESAYSHKEKSIKIIGKQGTWIVDNYTISGGSVGLFEGKKLGRKKSFEKLGKDIIKIESSIGKLTNHIEKLENQLEAFDLDSIGKKLQHISIQWNSIKYKLELEEKSINQLIENVKFRQQSVESKELSIATIKQEIVEKKNLLSTLNATFDKDQAALAKQKSKLADAQLQLNQLSNAFNNEKILKMQAQSEIDIVNNQIQNLTANKSKTNGSIASSKKEILDINEKLETISATAVDNKDLLVALMKEKEAHSQKLNVAEQDFYSKKSGLHELEKTIRQLNQGLMQHQSISNQLQEKLHTYTFEEKSLFDRLEIEFQVSRTSLESLEIEETSEDVTQLEINLDNLKIKISNYGEINPMAITAYEEIQKRHQYITEQRDDILMAQDDLQNTIKEIEETATEKFMDAFLGAKEHFKEVFRGLFTDDDDCDLILLDEENPLQSKIEIVAKPKGKRPKSLSQLSGGEKTLTATALLFALYLLKPAPFCILDEVDAPLDDSNIDKFTNLIRKFSDNSQFIIITHNKATMEQVDVLYGVYMQEVGVSELSAVDFRDKTFGSKMAQLTTK